MMHKPSRPRCAACGCWQLTVLDHGMRRSSIAIVCGPLIADTKQASMMVIYGLRVGRANGGNWRFAGGVRHEGASRTWMEERA